MPALTPDALHTLFAMGINAGDAQAVSQLFAEDAILVSDPENIVRGRAAIREGLENFLEIAPKMRLNASRVVRNGDIALLYSDWTITASKPDGSLFTAEVQPTHVARLGDDGTWLIVIDDPSAEGQKA
jgi:uncharacterized protein (TIGR02246 family)